MFLVAGKHFSALNFASCSMESLIYQEAPIVHLASNTFIDVPTVLQYEDVPLISVVHVAEAGFTAEIPIYHSDGTYLAKVVGSQIYPTAAGKKAGLILRHPGHATVCELNKQTLFELIREEAAALKTRAELYTPDGSFIRCADEGLARYVLGPKQEHLKIGNLTMIRSSVEHCKIGILVRKNGSIAVGVNNPNV